MYLLHGLQLSRIHKFFQNVLPDRFEHQQAWLLCTSVALLQQAFVQQGWDQVYGGKRAIRSSATDRFGSLQRTATDKEGQAPETALLLGSEEIITPTNGLAQGQLLDGSILPSTYQHGEPTVEP